MISPLAHIETCNLAAGVTVMEYAVIRKNVTLGVNVIVHPHVVIEAGVTIGEGSEIFPGTYIGKVPKGAGATSRSIAFVPQVEIGAFCAIGPHAVIFYDVQVGPNTLIGDGASIREKVRVGRNCLLSRYVTVNYNTTIGDRTKIMDSTHITGNTLIGSDVFISTMVATVNDHAPAFTYDEDQIRGPVIEDKATIGANATIMPGIRVGEGAFVGAGAVATKDIAPYDVVMGIPARPVKNMRLS